MRNQKEELQDYVFRYRTIADKASDREFWKNTQKEFKYLSSAFERITSYLAEDLKQSPYVIKHELITSLISR